MNKITMKEKLTVLTDLRDALYSRIGHFQEANEDVIKFLDRVKPQTPELDGERIALLVYLNVLKATNVDTKGNE